MLTFIPFRLRLIASEIMKEILTRYGVGWMAAGTFSWGLLHPLTARSAPLAADEMNDETRRPSALVKVEPVNDITLSLRFGLNVSGKFLGTGSSFTTGYVSNRRTPNGDPYNYDNGYVLTDVSGNVGNQTIYYGFDTTSQVSGTPNVQQFLSLDRTTVPDPAASADGSRLDSQAGAELVYHRGLGIESSRLHLRYGMELAFNYTPLSFNNSYPQQAVTLMDQRDTYALAAGTIAPSAPFQGGYYGPSVNSSSYAILTATPTTTTYVPVSGTFTAQEAFDSDLWGFRLGPYVKWPLTRQLSVLASGGLAAGLLAGSASWTETLTRVGTTTTIAGGGDDLAPLWGEFARLALIWRFNNCWEAEAGAQYQNLGIYDHDYGGRIVELDLRRSVFLEAGIGVSF